MASARQLLLLLLCCVGTLAETTLSPEVDPVITRNAYLKGQRDVIIEELTMLTPHNIELSCNLTDLPNNPPYITGYWTKDGKVIEDSEETVNRLNEHYVLKKTFSVQSKDLGNYSCVFRENEAQAAFILDAPVMKEKRDKPIVSYIGDSVVLECKLTHAPASWSWYRANDTDKVFINVTANPLNFRLMNKANVTKLTVLNVTEDDSGKYVCSAEFDIKHSHSTVELKVLSYTEPLKPFLVIVSEVVVLVALILLFERCSKQQQKNLSSSSENDVDSEQTARMTSEDNTGTESSTRQRKVEQ